MASASDDFWITVLLPGWPRRDYRWRILKVKKSDTIDNVKETIQAKFNATPPYNYWRLCTERNKILDELLTLVQLGITRHVFLRAMIMSHILPPDLFAVWQGCRSKSCSSSGPQGSTGGQHPAGMESQLVEKDGDDGEKDGDADDSDVHDPEAVEVDSGFS